MTYIRIKEDLYHAEINGKVSDPAWDNRACKAITLDMDYATASELFVDGLAWSIVYEREIPTYDENGEQNGTEKQTEEYDNSEYCIAGDITDHRDGTITAKMGKLTELEEAYELMLGGM